MSKTYNTDALEEYSPGAGIHVGTDIGGGEEFRINGSAKVSMAVVMPSTPNDIGQNSFDCYREDVWTPVLMATTTNPTLTYTTQSASYTRVGNRLLYDMRIYIASVSSNGSGTLYVPLPAGIVPPWNTPGELITSSLNLNNSTRSLAAEVATDGRIYFIQMLDSTAYSRIAAGGGVLTTGTIISVSGHFRPA